MNALIDVSLKGQTAIVTGGSNGIGEAVANTLMKAGANVLVVDREQPQKGKWSVSSSQTDAQVDFFLMNLYETEKLKQIVAYADEQFGRIDLLVNCAGIYPSQPALTITEGHWNRVLDLNLKVPFFLAQAVADYMIERQIKGSIINIASTAAAMARPGVAHYCSSKAGLVMLTRVLALEWAQHGIRVNAVCPGLVETEALLASLTTQDLQKEHQEKISKAPLMRAAKPEEIAQSVLFFADNAAAGFITGQAFYIDGGYTAGQTFTTFKDILNSAAQ